MLTLNSLLEIQKFTYRNSKKTRVNLIVDTCVFLLLLVGTYDPNCIKQCKQTSKYTIEHFNLLCKILNFFNQKVTVTPHLLVEIHSHARNMFADKRLTDYLSVTIDKLKECQEQYVPFEILLANEKSLVQFGFTDLSIVEAARNLKGVVLTDEFEMYRVFNNHVPVIKFGNVASREIYGVDEI